MEIALNLSILPLDIVDHIASQKCLLPNVLFPKGVSSGSWAKCIKSGNRYAICQIYPRNLRGENYCYIDRCVISQEAGKMSGECYLQQLQLLEGGASIAEVSVTIVVTGELFSRNSKRVTRDFLLIAVQELMQPFGVTIGSAVRSKEFAEMGIECVNINSATCEENTVFFITDTTNIILDDIKYKSDCDVAVFHNNGFERARQSLDDLLQVAKMQRTRRPKVRLSLNALLVGPAGCGKSSLAATFIKESNCNCFLITIGNVLGQYPGETESELRRIFETVRSFELQLRPKNPTVILLEDLHLLCPSVKASGLDGSSSMRICAQLLSLIDGLYKSRAEIICLATTSSPESINAAARRPGRFEREISIEALRAEVRSQLFAALFRDAFPGENADALLTAEILDTVAKHSQGYVVADLELLIRTTLQTFTIHTHCDLAAALEQSLKQAKPTSMRGSDISVYATEQGFDALGGMTRLKQTLEISILAALRQRQAFNRFGLSLPKGVLLYGPPGCAKTALAKCLATEANMTFIATSAAEVYSPYVGCAEKLIAKIFDTARKNAPCLIFLDEIDSLVGRRAISSNVSSDVQTRILSTLLTEMDGIIDTNYAANADKHILVVAATNRPDMVDEALLRPGRFDKLIHVPAPDLESRRSLLQLHARYMPFAYDVNLDALAECTENYSGADICNLCNEAAMQAFQRDFCANAISAQDFDTVLRVQKSSLTQRQIKWYMEFENQQLAS